MQVRWMALEMYEVGRHTRKRPWLPHSTSPTQLYTDAADVYFGFANNLYARLIIFFGACLPLITLPAGGTT